MVKKRKKISESVDWYKRNRGVYETLAEKVASIIEDNLKLKKLDYHSVTFRAKDESSFEAKARNAKYSDPAREITDLAGTRIIAYVDSEVRVISDLVKDLIAVDADNSEDK